MVNAAPVLPRRCRRAPRKPRRRGHHARAGQGAAGRRTSRRCSTSAAPYVDVWKFGWGTAYLDPGLPAKLAPARRRTTCSPAPAARCSRSRGSRAPSRRTSTGPTEVGFPCVEVSRGVAPIPDRARSEADRRRAAERFVVLAEIGVKDAGAAVVARDAWAAEAAADLRRRRHLGGHRGPRERHRRALRRRTGACAWTSSTPSSTPSASSTTVFEAPRKDQQAWLIRRFGADVNLGEHRAGRGARSRGAAARAARRHLRRLVRPGDDPCVTQVVTPA